MFAEAKQENGRETEETSSILIILYPFIEKEAKHYVSFVQNN